MPQRPGRDNPMRFDELKDTPVVSIAEGTKLNVRGTPSFFFGYPDPKNPKQMKAMQFVSGAVPIEQFKEALDKLLDPPKEGSSN